MGLEYTLWLCIAFMGVFSIIGVVNILYLWSITRDKKKKSKPAKCAGMVKEVMKDGTVHYIC